MVEGMRDRVQEVWDRLKADNPHRTIEGKELGELYIRFNEECERIRRDYARREAAQFEIEASFRFITD